MKTVKVLSAKVQIEYIVCDGDGEVISATAGAPMTVYRPTSDDSFSQLQQSIESERARIEEQVNGHADG